MGQGTPVTWEVTNITQETKFGMNGTPIPGKNVTFKTSTGYEGTLFIADSIFTDVNAVRLAIDGEVRAVTNALTVKGTLNG